MGESISMAFKGFFRASGVSAPDSQSRVAHGRAVSAVSRVLLVVTGVVICAGFAARGVAAEARPRLLLLPIVVHSAEPPAYVREGLADMLSTRFGRIGSLEIERIDDPARATTDLDRAIAAGRDAGADYVLYGSFTRFGKGASLDVHCAPVSTSSEKEPLREIFVHSGSIGEIIPDLDELAGKVSRFVRGETVESPDPSRAGTASRISGPGVSAADLADLVDRIERLEAAVVELGESNERGASAPE